MYHIFFIHSSVHGHLSCFHVLAIVNSASMNIGVHVSFRIRVFIFSGCMPKSEIAGWDIFLGGYWQHSEWRFGIPIDVCSVSERGIRSQMQICHLAVWPETTKAPCASVFTAAKWEGYDLASPSCLSDKWVLGHAGLFAAIGHQSSHFPQAPISLHFCLEALDSVSCLEPCFYPLDLDFHNIS